MEEVFIKVGRVAADQIIADEFKRTHSAEELAAGKVKPFEISLHSVNGSKTNLYSKDKPPRNTGVKLVIQQFRAMLVKKCIYAVRNRILLLGQVILPPNFNGNLSDDTFFFKCADGGSVALLVFVSFNFEDLAWAHRSTCYGLHIICKEPFALIVVSCLCSQITFYAFLKNSCLYGGLPRHSKAREVIVKSVQGARTRSCGDKP